MSAPIRFVGGDDGNVFVIDSESVRRLGDFEWGGQTASCADLARAILRAMTNNEAMVNRLHRRFMHRTVAIWSKGQPWTATTTELTTVVEDIQRVEREAAADVSRMAREPMRGMQNAGGLPDESEWAGGKPPVLHPNKPK